MGIAGFVLILVIVVLMTLSGGAPRRPYAFWDTPSHIFLWGFLGGCILLSRTSIRLLARSLWSIRFPKTRHVRRFVDGETLASSLFLGAV